MLFQNRKFSLMWKKSFFFCKTAVQKRQRHLDFGFVVTFIYYTFLYELMEYTCLHLRQTLRIMLNFYTVGSYCFFFDTALVNTKIHFCMIKEPLSTFKTYLVPRKIILILKDKQSELDKMNVSVSKRTVLGSLSFDI